MTLPVAQLVAELADREAIRDCLYRYCRGVDRCDEQMLRSAYWEDAYDDHSGRAARGDPGRRVLEHDALRRVRSQLRGGEQVALRLGLPPAEALSSDEHPRCGQAGCA